jgi:hypothetical protein
VDRRATLFFPRRVADTLTFAIVLAVVKLWSRIGGGRGEYAS